LAAPSGAARRIGLDTDVDLEAPGADAEAGDVARRLSASAYPGFTRDIAPDRIDTRFDHGEPPWPLSGRLAGLVSMFCTSRP
jgi:hypothetical protein